MFRTLLTIVAGVVSLAGVLGVTFAAAPPPASAAPKAITDPASGLTGYQAADGTWTISPRFRSGSDFDQGLAIAETRSAESVLIDTRGEVLLEDVEAALWVSLPTLTEAKVSEGLLALRDRSSGKVGFVDARGKWVIRPRFADAFEFHEGLAAFRMRENGPVGFIDARGRVVIAAKFGTRFRSPPVFAEGLAAGTPPTDRVHVFDAEGQSAPTRPDFRGVRVYPEALSPAEADALRKELGDAIEFVQPQGGLFVWARLTGAGGKVNNGNELAKRAIEQGVAFVPGAPFYATNPDLSTLRLSFATADVGKIEEGVGRLGKAVIEG